MISLKTFVNKMAVGYWLMSGFYEGMQKQIKLNDKQNLRTFNLKLLKRLLQKREVRIIRLKMKGWITRRLYRKYPGVPPLLHENSDSE